MLLGGICPTPCAPYFRLSQGIHSIVIYCLLLLLGWMNDRRNYPLLYHFFYLVSVGFLHPNYSCQLAFYDELIKLNYESYFHQFLLTICVFFIWEKTLLGKVKYLSSFSTAPNEKYWFSKICKESSPFALSWPLIVTYESAQIKNFCGLLEIGEIVFVD